jgi:hypothetical protein
VRRLAIPVALLAAGLAIATSAERARAQRLGVHGRLGLPSERPLHVRVALADAAAIATIEAVGLGRIRVRDAIPVLGDVAAAFELKRAPSRPPALEPGDRALLILRGARPPYILVDDGDETRTLFGAASEVLWREALREVHRSLGAGLLDVYRSWLDGAQAPLRRAAVIGLGDPEAPFQPLPPLVADRLALLAIDPDADLELRRLSGRVATQSEVGRRALLVRLPGGDGADSQVLAQALRIATVEASPGAGDALQRALRHPRVDIRLSALRIGPIFDGDAAARGEFERLAAEDPDPRVRAAALRALGRPQH